MGLPHPPASPGSHLVRRTCEFERKCMATHWTAGGNEIGPQQGRKERPQDKGEHDELVCFDDCASSIERFSILSQNPCPMWTGGRFQSQIVIHRQWRNDRRWPKAVLLIRRSQVRILHGPPDSTELAFLSRPGRSRPTDRDALPPAAETI